MKIKTNDGYIDNFDKSKIVKSIKDDIDFANKNNIIVNVNTTNGLPWWLSW